MFRDPFVQKAWDICHQTERCPVEIILEATVWLEEKYGQVHQGESAIVIALQYLVLAMRREFRARPGVAKEYFSRAVRWREEARRWLNERSLLTAPQSHN